jgi:hypothetical protein
MTLPSGYTSTTIFDGLGYPTVSRTPYITIPQLSYSSSTFGSYTSTIDLPAQTGSGASITSTLTSTAVSSLTISPGGTNYVNPGIVFSGGGGSGASAILLISNGVITGYNIISGGTGYSSAPTCTIVPNGGSFSGNSTATPVGSTVNSIIVRCSIVKNACGSPNDILDSFPISAGSSFGANINYSPNINKWVRVNAGSYSNFVITFTDQNLNLLQALDSNILATILLKFPDKK